MQSCTVYYCKIRTGYCAVVQIWLYSRPADFDTKNLKMGAGNVLSVLTVGKRYSSGPYGAVAW